MVKKIKPVIYSVPIQVFTVPGVGHDWKTWEKLWKQVLDHIEAKISE